jgi:hypothetical protein
VSKLSSSARSTEKEKIDWPPENAWSAKRRKEFDADQAVGTWVDEAELEKEWPALRVQIAESSRTWRLRGLNLIGSTQLQPVIELPQQPTTTEFSPESHGLHRSHSSPSAPAPVVAPTETLAVFAGLPLFDLAVGAGTKGDGCEFKRGQVI